MAKEHRVRRPRLTVDAPDYVVANARKTADRYFRGSLSDAVVSAFALFNWFTRQRSSGKRVISVASDLIPAAFEEPMIPGLEEAMANKWIWLVEREHPWRRQLWIKGRNVTAGSIARTMEIEGWTPEQTADQYDLELDTVLEAVRYARDHAALIAAEEAESRLAAETAAQAGARVVSLPR